MKIAIQRSALAAAILSLFLSACGGGGGSPSSNGAAPASGASTTPATPASGVGSTPATPASEASSTATAAISLLALGAPAPTPFAATGDFVADALAYINRQRALLGLSAMAPRAAVAQAATNHSLYLQDNNVVGHYETAGLRGFTGVTPTDRVNPLYPTPGAGEILSAVFGPFENSAQPIQLLFDAPFHRSGILSDATGAGAGVAVSGNVASLSALTVDFVDYKPAAPDDKLIAYPYPGQTDAQPSWLDTESPDPFGAAPQSYFGKTVGYPVTLIGSNAASFSQVSFTITDPTGASTPCQESDSSNNTEAALMAMCAPFAPLTAGVTYSVHVTGLMSNASFTTPRPFDVSWSFATAPATAASAKAAIGAPPRQVVTDSANAHALAKRH